MGQRLARLQLGVGGMDCAQCALHVEEAVRSLPGVRDARVLLGAERLDVVHDPDLVDLGQVTRAVERAGYHVKDGSARAAHAGPAGLAARVAWTFAALVAVVFLVAMVGEGLGLLDAALEHAPPGLAVAAVLLGGYPIFKNVLTALRRGKVTAHALMTLGVAGALAIGEYPAAAVIVVFMRVAEALESYTTRHARRALSALTRLAPDVAHLARDGREEDVPAAALKTGDRVAVRPGERVPADGVVVAGQAAVDQSPITGESMPVEKLPGAEVFAGTIVHGGRLEVRVTRTGPESTLGRIIKLVEEAEARKAPIQRVADRFTAWYLPVVVGVAGATYLLGRNPTAAIAVLLVACACAVALATPTAVIASVGAAARRGILIKGGRYLEALARADTLVMDKTGTLTFGRPAVTDVVALDGHGAVDVLRLAAAAERFSEHPVAAAVRTAAARQGIAVAAPERFEPLVGLGVQARWNGHDVLVGSRRLLDVHHVPLPRAAEDRAAGWEAQGKTAFYVVADGRPVGMLAVADTPRPEVPEALGALRRLGIRRIVLLTGDNERSARALAAELGAGFRANLLPEDKIAVVRKLQARGHVVIVVGDGVNDAPALAQADVGVAMGVAGTDAAMEAADVVLMGDDWRALAEAVRIGRRTFRVIQQNLAVGVLYNVVGMSLAAVGLLPPVVAAASQSLPDLLIMLNSTRLLRSPAGR